MLVHLAITPQQPLLGLCRCTQFIDQSLQHGSATADRMMPVNFAEHDVSRKDHHLGRSLALDRDTNIAARRPHAHTAQQSSLIKIATVRYASMQAVTLQVVEFVDVDRAAEQTAYQRQPTDEAPRSVPGWGAIKSATTRGSIRQSDSIAWRSDRW